MERKIISGNHHEIYARDEHLLDEHHANGFQLFDFMDLQPIEKCRLFLREFGNKTYFQTWRFSIAELKVTHDAIFKTEILTSLTPKKGKTNTVIEDIKQQIEPFRNINWNKVIMKIKKDVMRVEKLRALRLEMVPWINKLSHLTAKISIFLDSETSLKPLALDKFNAEYEDLVEMFPKQAAKEVESPMPLSFENYIAELPAYKNYENRINQAVKDASKELEKLAKKQAEILSEKAASRRKFLKTAAITIAGIGASAISWYLINKIKQVAWKTINLLELDQKNLRIIRYVDISTPEQARDVLNRSLLKLFKNADHNIFSDNTTDEIINYMATLIRLTSYVTDTETTKIIKNEILHILIPHFIAIYTNKHMIRNYIIAHNCIKMAYTLFPNGTTNRNACPKLTRLSPFGNNISLAYNIEFTKQNAGSFEKATEVFILFFFLSDKLLGQATKEDHIASLKEISNFYEEKLQPSSQQKARPKDFTTGRIY